MRTANGLLAAATLPGPQDDEAMIPPTQVAYVRRVVGENLWVYFTFDDDVVTLIVVVTMPPVPLDDD